MRNNLDPVFTTAIVVDYFFEEVRASHAAAAHPNAPGLLHAPVAYLRCRTLR
jgi:hypothetical protein